MVSGEKLCRLKRGLPFDRHMLVTGCGLDQMAASGERKVIAGHQHAVSGSPIEQILARGNGRLAVKIERRLPIGMAREYGRMLGGVAEHQQRLVAGVNGEHRMAGSVAGRRQGGNAGRNSWFGLKRVTTFSMSGKNTPLIAKSEFQVVRCSAEVCVVHPEFPFRRRHHYLGIWKDDFVILILEAIDVVWMEMRDGNQIDGLRIDAGSELGFGHAWIGFSSGAQRYQIANGWE